MCFLQGMQSHLSASFQTAVHSASGVEKITIYMHEFTHSHDWLVPLWLIKERKHSETMDGRCIIGIWTRDFQTIKRTLFSSFESVRDSVHTQKEGPLLNPVMRETFLLCISPLDHKIRNGYYLFNYLDKKKKPNLISTLKTEDITPFKISCINSNILYM